MIEAVRRIAGYPGLARRGMADRELVQQTALMIGNSFRRKLLPLQPQ